MRFFDRPGFSKDKFAGTVALTYFRVWFHHSYRLTSLVHSANIPVLAHEIKILFLLTIGAQNVLPVMEIFATIFSSLNHLSKRPPGMF